MYKWWKNARNEWFWQDKKDPSKWTKFTGLSSSTKKLEKENGPDSEMAMVQELFYNDHYYQSMYRRNVVCCFCCKEISAVHIQIV